MAAAEVAAALVDGAAAAAAAALAATRSWRRHAPLWAGHRDRGVLPSGGAAVAAAAASNLDLSRPLG